MEIITLIILISILWWINGIVSFLYYEYEYLQFEDWNTIIIWTLIIGLFGPLNWIGTYIWRTL